MANSATHEKPSRVVPFAQTPRVPASAPYQAEDWARVIFESGTGVALPGGGHGPSRPVTRRDRRLSCPVLRVYALGRSSALRAVSLTLRRVNGVSWSIGTVVLRVDDLLI